MATEEEEVKEYHFHVYWDQNDPREGILCCARIHCIPVYATMSKGQDGFRKSSEFFFAASP